MTPSRRYLIRPEAEKDLKGISRYTQSAWGPEQARKYLRALHQKLQRLAANPNLGVMRDDVGRGYRSAPVGHHLVFYRLVGDDIVVVRVLHESMNVQRHLEVSKTGGKEAPSPASPTLGKRKR